MRRRYDCQLDVEMNMIMIEALRDGLADALAQLELCTESITPGQGRHATTGAPRRTSLGGVRDGVGGLWARAHTGRPTIKE